MLFVSKIYGASVGAGVAPDKRIKGLEELYKVKGKDFEVVQPTGPNEGPRKK